MTHCSCDPCLCAETARDPSPTHANLEALMRRLGVVMEPDPKDPNEAEGVLNPGVARARDGQLYLFPRVVAPGNYSRIARVRVHFDVDGDPYGVERLGYALEPGPRYERNGNGGGCEDPRITFFHPLDVYLMTYVVWGPSGPRIALAVSKDLVRWRRTGRVDFRPDPAPVYCTDFDYYHNKDGLIFPDTVPGPDGRPSLALIHRPVYQTARGRRTRCEVPCGISDPRPSIWISYCALEEIGDRFVGPLRLKHHHCLAEPVPAWEEYRIGGGAPPILTDHGWLLVYHGVSRNAETEETTYRVGVMLLDPADPRRVLSRTTRPVLEPENEWEQTGVVSNVVFPTGLDVRTDIGQPYRVDVYYGMADARIGVASLTLPKH